MTDRQLLEAYVAGRDVGAFETFVGRHEAALLSFAASYLGSETHAQDVVQEAFLRVARYPYRLLGWGSNERNWLLKVVRDLSVDSLRRGASERRAVGQLAVSSPETAAPADAAAEARERAAEVQAAIARLRPRLRELLILKVREHKSYKEIAQITGLSVTNVGFLLHQAMQALTQELKE